MKLEWWNSRIIMLRGLSDLRLSMMYYDGLKYGDDVKDVEEEIDRRKQVQCSLVGTPTTGTKEKQ